jgi:hypothetical protein
MMGAPVLSSKRSLGFCARSLDEHRCEHRIDKSGAELKSNPERGE